MQIKHTIKAQSFYRQRDVFDCMLLSVLFRDEDHMITYIIIFFHFSLSSYDLIMLGVASLVLMLISEYHQSYIAKYAKFVGFGLCRRYWTL